MRPQDQQTTVSAGQPDLAEVASKLRALSGQLTRRLRAASEGDGITMSQAAVLSRLVRKGPATTVELARAERVRPQSMGATLAALEEAGLVQRSPHPSDRRQMIMSLTEQGRRKIEEGRRIKESWIVQALRDRLDDRERAVVIEAIELLGRLTEED
ncbi:MarR family winged helix-turn-helix transcriptional regulator [Streptomyces orinoci]|uniref:MarR family transcriptional regulator n=1 Tax=Streptomyces orinoci TaxID=67339 RepID=A0ABV3JVD6_STRON|nr:MarR family transcriptional regulator [Streptomyces orinoci]